MDVTALEAALPAETVTALTLITNAGTQVYVDEEQRSTGSVSPQAWWRRLDPEIEPGGAGEIGIGYGYSLRVEKTAATDAELLLLTQEILQHFGARKAPGSISGHIRTSVEDPIIDKDPGETGLRSVEALVTFHGREVINV